MMTIKRFCALVDSYGADLQRWPGEVRSQARALLDSSTEAQQIVARERRLDEAIAAAGAERNKRLWSGDHPEAALVRLRSNVAARTGPATAAPAARGIHVRIPLGGRHSVGWLGLATAAGVAIVAGIALGALYSPSTSQQDLLAMLQPSPIELPGD